MISITPLQPSLITVCLMNYKRASNTPLIIDALAKQTARPVIYLWNNGLPFYHPAVDWQIESTNNGGSCPRCFMLSRAKTDWVMTHDDDLMLTDPTCLEQAIARNHSQCTGLVGRNLIDGSYKHGQDVAAGRKDQYTDIVKGRLLMLPLAKLKKCQFDIDFVHDDISISGMVAEGKYRQHLIPSCFHKAFRELPAPSAVSAQPGHYENRDKESARWFTT